MIKRFYLWLIGCPECPKCKCRCWLAPGENFNNPYYTIHYCAACNIHYKHCLKYNYTSIIENPNE